MFCNKCGNQVPDGAKFCGRCGNAITVAPAAPVTPAPPAMEELEMPKVTITVPPVAEPAPVAKPVPVADPAPVAEPAPAVAEPKPFTMPPVAAVPVQEEPIPAQMPPMPEAVYTPPVQSEPVYIPPVETPVYMPPVETPAYMPRPEQGYAPVQAAPQPEITPEDLPSQYRPLSAWAYWGLSLLYMVPVVGFIFLIIFSFKSDNINRRSFTRSYWINYMIFGILLLTAIGIIAAIDIDLLEDIIDSMF